jgi:catechol 2,3-dioxygenase-like lactoylglutathione lyase family enzyme
MRGIDHVGLTVGDLDRSLAFWRDALGLALISRGVETSPVLARLLRRDRVEIEVADLDAGDGRVIELIRYVTPAGREVRAEPYDPGSTHVAIRVDDLEATVARLRATASRSISSSAVRLDAPGTRWDGATCYYLADPDGIFVELIQHPKDPE